ncbi:proline-rich protein HaeIII subfamily 1 [Bubalus bubalis]|uniref:proline-rich protein HaeIII subfamily 1 n=1 Tax=Bubalus bubalis TaxID=89462 RepID=UPI001D0FB784|nr:proline-rich protein HaeIII subfamily 1 [Bubalus bubalis]
MASREPAVRAGASPRATGKHCGGPAGPWTLAAPAGPGVLGRAVRRPGPRDEPGGRRADPDPPEVVPGGGAARRPSGPIPPGGGSAGPERLGTAGPEVGPHRRAPPRALFRVLSSGQGQVTARELFLAVQLLHMCQIFSEMTLPEETQKLTQPQDNCKRS